MNLTLEEQQELELERIQAEQEDEFLFNLREEYAFFENEFYN